MNGRPLSVAAAGALAAVLGAAGGCSRELPADSANAAMRFAIEVPPSSPGPVYVQLNEEDGQPGWVTAVRNGGERVALWERCEIADCGRSTVVCGLAPPMVRDLAAAGRGGKVEFRWDGMTSVVDAEAECERRVPAAAGTYVAALCYSRDARVEMEGGAGQPVLGRVVDPICDTTTFRLPDPEDIVVRLGPDSQ